LNAGDADFLYKSKVLAGIVSKRAFAGPYIVDIGYKYSCNYKCIFCEWFSPMSKKSRKDTPSSHSSITMEVYRGLIKELSLLGTKIVIIGEFEPFMDPQLIEKIEYTKKHNLGCFLITNGSLLNKENAEQLVNLKLDYLNVSINAGTPETYPRIHVTETEETFERIVSMVSLIEKLKENKRTVFPHTRLSMVVCNRNYHDIVNFVELCQETGVKNAHIKKLISTSKEMAEELELTPKQEKEMNEYLGEALNFAKKYDINVDIEWADWTSSQKTRVKQEDLPCYYGWLFSMIDDNGNVYPCCFQDRSPSCTIGNIRDESFTTIWFSKKYQDFRRKYKKIAERRKMGYHCNQPSCVFTNQQIYEILNKPYLLPLRYIT
jgi:radical SAM protein with 4Fe4S-binding SPASM domain